MKGQFTPLGAIILVAVMISLLSMAYIWGKPLIDEQQMVLLYGYSKSKHIEIRDAISEVASSEGSQASVLVELTRMDMHINEGVPYSGTIIQDNSIDFVMDVKRSIIPGEDWKVVDPEEKLAKTVGEMGSDRAAVILAREQNGRLTVRLWYRDLKDPNNSGIYRINLLKDKTSVISGGVSKLVFKNTGEYRSDKYTFTNITVFVE